MDLTVTLNARGLIKEKSPMINIDITIMTVNVRQNFKNFFYPHHPITGKAESAKLCISYKISPQSLSRMRAFLRTDMTYISVISLVLL
jgi:hypothetical protein